MANLTLLAKEHGPGRIIGCFSVFRDGQVTLIYSVQYIHAKEIYTVSEERNRPGAHLSLTQLSQPKDSIHLNASLENAILKGLLHLCMILPDL